MSAMGGPIAINHLAIDAAMDREDIEDRKDCFNKVERLCEWWLNRVNRKE